MAPQGKTRERFIETFRRCGVSESSVEFADRRPRHDYYLLHHRIDVNLDPFPFNSHTCGLDAYWMGVPTVTLIGETVVAREGWSQACNLDLRELAAHSPEEYIAIATTLASNLPRLAELRRTLRQRMLASPLMDAKRYTRHMEQALREVWRTWCREDAANSLVRG